MNERIKEFAKQTLSKDQFGLWLAGDGDIEKFTELIVQECLMKINGAKIRNESYDELIERIKEDFGVK
jgi:hypothetical protein